MILPNIYKVTGWLKFHELFVTDYRPIVFFILLYNIIMFWMVWGTECETSKWQWDQEEEKYHKGYGKESSIRGNNSNERFCILFNTSNSWNTNTRYSHHFGINFFLQCLNNTILHFWCHFFQLRYIWF